MTNMKKSLRKNMKVIRKYKNQNCTDKETWLSADFYIIENAYKEALGTLKNDRNNLLRRCTADFCYDMCTSGILPEKEKIISELIETDITTPELQELKTILIWSLLKHAAIAIECDDNKIENCVKSLFRLADTDFNDILCEVSKTEKILCKDPSGIYTKMSEQTKNQYRTAVFRKAIKDGKSETETAAEILQNALKENKHIGFFIDLNNRKKHTGIALLTAEASIPVIAGGLLCLLTSNLFILPLIYFPLREILKFITDTAFSLLPSSQPLPEMDYSLSIPQSEKTVIAVSVLMTSSAVSENMYCHLKNLCLSVCRDNVSICILADLRNADEPFLPSDNADIKKLKTITDRLNCNYGNKFTLAVRKRVYSCTENKFTGYERKRGAINELINYIHDSTDNFFLLHGNKENLKNAKYVMALDSDTNMPPGSINELIAIASHPLNSPVVSQKLRKVISGYAIISPATETQISSASATYYSSVMAGCGGLSSYTGHIREKYMELFGRSIFSGKGLIDVNAFYTVMKDRLPEQKILSHDIIEGILLRTAFAGSTVLTDSFPSNQTAYFKRLHRWIRGDIQNLRFIFRQKNKKSFTADSLGRYWIIDNVRRAVTHLLSLLCLIISVFANEPSASVLSIIAVLSAVMPDLVSFFVTLRSGGIPLIFRRYFSANDSYPVTCLKRAFVSLISLPENALNSLDAITRALFRMIITKKHLLEWTTASDSDKNRIISIIKRTLPSFFIGLFLLIFAPPIAQIAGIFFMLDIPFSLLSAKKKPEKMQELTKNETLQLKTYCRAMWRFYEEHCTKENNFLIPDNVQETPVYRTAHRTSPTNIGMMLCAFLAARDFEFINSDELYFLLRNSFDSIDKLEKYEGHLYNWYDTRTLEKIPEYFISTVDSGNFMCCITALGQGLRSYLQENKKLNEIIQKCNSLIDNCNMEFLYNKRRNLFRIGYNTEKNEFSDSYFDLLMSEARMTSYFAAASGKVPVDHWKTLDRTLSECRRYSGAVSWSGTMFEYFMPAIFIPAEKNTLEYESLHFCIYCQKQRVKHLNIPYGISESGYFAFDSALNYQYKAHGTDKLALRRFPMDETVISPYSSFLTLSYNPHSALKNLKALEKYGMYGKFGFFEAIDFTGERTDGQKYRIIRSYMSHHIGMSFLSAANCIFNNIMQKRFMQNDFMSRGAGLLEERIPTASRTTSLNRKKR